MTDALAAREGAEPRSAWGGARLGRALLLAALAGGAGLGALAASQPGAVAVPADDGLAALLRLMALLKAVLALGAVAAVWWRLAMPVPGLRLLGYLAATAAMAAGPGLIWGLEHVGRGALLLHGGLAAALVLLWRDPATAAMIGEAVARRRRALAAAPPRGRGAATSDRS